MAAMMLMPNIFHNNGAISWLPPLISQLFSPWLAAPVFYSLAVLVYVDITSFCNCKPQSQHMASFVFFFTTGIVEQEKRHLITCQFKIFLHFVLTSTYA